MCITVNTIFNRQQKPKFQIFKILLTIKGIVIELTNIKWYLLKYSQHIKYAYSDFYMTLQKLINGEFGQL